MTTYQKSLAATQRSLLESEEENRKLATDRSAALELARAIEEVSAEANLWDPNPLPHMVLYVSQIRWRELEALARKVLGKEK